MVLESSGTQVVSIVLLSWLPCLNHVLTSTVQQKIYIKIAILVTKNPVTSVGMLVVVLRQGSSCVRPNLRKRAQEELIILP